MSINSKFQTDYENNRKGNPNLSLKSGEKPAEGYLTFNEVEDRNSFNKNFITQKRDEKLVDLIDHIRRLQDIVRDPN